MGVDSDPISISTRRPDDFASVLLDLIGSVQWKLIWMIYIAFLFVSSDLFINRILTKFPNATDLKLATNYGIMLQGLFLVLISIVVDALIHQKVI